MTRWKDHERQLAKAIGGVRNGNQGVATADVENDWLCIEAKSWQGGVKRVEAALQQAEGAADCKQLPIAVIHTVGRRHASDLVVMRWGAFLDWFGDDVMASADDAAEGAFADAVRLAQADDDDAANWLRTMAPDYVDEGG